jgi:hypothetical protein
MLVVEIIDVLIRKRGRISVPFLPLICSENAAPTSVAVVTSPNSGKEVIVSTE